jgi:hypothetical protein
MQQHLSLRPQQGGRPSRLRFGAALSLLGLVALVVASTAGACSSEPCVGGYLKEDGTCEGKCDPSLCIQDNTCVGNRCVLECAAHGECLEDGSQACAPAVEDDTGRAIMICKPHEQPTGFGSPCPFGPECKSFGKCNGTGAACNLNAYTPCNGQPCNGGTCPDGSACAVQPCSQADCVAPLACITSGEGDADAYCTKHDCQSDTDCASGYYCGVTHDPHELCGSMNPTKGNSGFCGETTEECIPESALGNGNTLFEGQFCILRKTCLKRDECAPCSTDLDCSLELGQRCAAMPGESQKRCARPCKTSDDCERAYECVPDASAPGGGGVCVHRFGACTGAGQFCEPCLNDTECGSLTGSMACLLRADGNGGCVDAKAELVSCTKDDDCPVAPSGKHAYCDLKAGKCTALPCALYEIDPGTMMPYCAKLGCW